MQYAALTHIGLVRKENQDRYGICELDDARTLLILSDGMGGEAEGALAAGLVLDTLSTLKPAERFEADLAALAVRAGERILKAAQSDAALEGMGATVVAVVVGNGRADWVNLGDSRLYHFGRRGFERVSRDHSFIQELLEAGDLTPEEARKHPMRHVLDQCAGTPGARPDTGSFALDPGDRILLCSDGLHGYVPDSRIREILSGNGAPEELARLLVDEALARGGRDNVTVVLAQA